MSCRHCQQKGKRSKTYPMNQKNEILTLSLFISLERGEIHAKKLKVRIASRVHSRNLSIMTWTAGPIVLQPWVNPSKKKLIFSANAMKHQKQGNKGYLTFNTMDQNHFSKPIAWSLVLDLWYFDNKSEDKHEKTSIFSMFCPSKSELRTKELLNIGSELPTISLSLLQIYIRRHR